MTGTIIYSMIIMLSAFEYHGGEPLSLFPFSTAAESYSMPGVYRNPLSVTGGAGGTISVCASRPYSEDEMHSCYSGLKYSKENLGIQFLGHSFGTDFYTENRLSVSAGLSHLKMINTGFTVSAYKLDIDTDEKHISRTMYDGDIGSSITPFNWITLAFVQNCISSALTGSSRYELYPERSAGILLRPCSGFTLSWNNTYTAAGFINSFHAGISPSTFMHLHAGYTPEDTRFAASLTILLKHLSATYSLSSHPYLGYTHSFGVTLTSFSEIESIKYGTPSVFSPDKKININSATPEEIKNISGLSTRSADRIILYREKIGPVSEKALKSIGLDSDEISSVKKNCYGMARGSQQKETESFKSNPRKKNKIYLPPKERVKAKFRILVKEGIPASAAIRYSELSESARIGEIDSILEGDKNLSDDQKDIIRRRCTR